MCVFVYAWIDQWVVPGVKKKTEKDPQKWPPSCSQDLILNEKLEALYARQGARGTFSKQAQKHCFGGLRDVLSYSYPYPTSPILPSPRLAASRLPRPPHAFVRRPPYPMSPRMSSAFLQTQGRGDGGGDGEGDGRLGLFLRRTLTRTICGFDGGCGGPAALPTCCPSVLSICSGVKHSALPALRGGAASTSPESTPRY